MILQKNRGRDMRRARIIAKQWISRRLELFGPLYHMCYISYVKYHTTLHRGIDRVDAVQYDHSYVHPKTSLPRPAQLTDRLSFVLLFVFSSFGAQRAQRRRRLLPVCAAQPPASQPAPRSMTNASTLLFTDSRDHDDDNTTTTTRRRRHDDDDTTTTTRRRRRRRQRRRGGGPEI
jgi:hypothetical protein